MSTRFASVLLVLCLIVSAKVCKSGSKTSTAPSSPTVSDSPSPSGASSPSSAPNPPSSSGGPGTFGSLGVDIDVFSEAQPYLTRLQPAWYRVLLDWSREERTEGKFDISKAQEAVTWCHAHNIKVFVVLGQSVPQWFHGDPQQWKTWVQYVVANLPGDAWGPFNEIDSRAARFNLDQSWERQTISDAINILKAANKTVVCCSSGNNVRDEPVLKMVSSAGLMSKIDIVDYHWAGSSATSLDDPPENAGNPVGFINKFKAIQGLAQGRPVWETEGHWNPGACVSGSLSDRQYSAYNLRAAIIIMAYGGVWFDWQPDGWPANPSPSCTVHTGHGPLTDYVNAAPQLSKYFGSTGVQISSSRGSYTITTSAGTIKWQTSKDSFPTF